MLCGEFARKVTVEVKDQPNHASLSCYRWTCATCCIPSFVLYTKVDAQCDKLVMGVGRTQSTAFATVDVPWRNFS